MVRSLISALIFSRQSLYWKARKPDGVSLYIRILFELKRIVVSNKKTIFGV